MRPGLSRERIAPVHAGTMPAPTIHSIIAPATMARNYIPNRDADCRDWAVNFSTLITATPVTYGLIAGDATAIAAVVDPFVAAYTVATDPATRTSATIAAKDAARAAMEAVVRPYAVQISLNDGVTDEDKVAVGVTVKKLVPTPVPAPTTQPILGVVNQIPGQIRMSYRDAELPAGKAKPPGVIGLELYVSKGVAPAVDPSLAAYRGTVTKSPLALTFEAGDQGKVATVFARWVTRSGPAGVAQVGPWSTPVSTIIT